MSETHQGDAPDPAAEELIETRAAAELLKTHISTIYRWIEQGRLRCWKRVGRRLVRRADLVALLVPVAPRRKRGREVQASVPRTETKAQGYARAEAELRKRGFRVPG